MNKLRAKYGRAYKEIISPLDMFITTAAPPTELNSFILFLLHLELGFVDSLNAPSKTFSSPAIPTLSTSLPSITCDSKLQSG